MTISMGKSARTARLVTVALATTLAAFAGSALAGNDAPQITVRYDKSTDTSQLYSRLQSASTAVCRQHEGRELRNLADTRACHNEALSNAVAKVGSAALTSLHHANTDMRLAEHDMNRRSRS